jgi:hypothetical protein
MKPVDVTYPFQETLTAKGKIFKTLDDLQGTCEGIFRPELAHSPSDLSAGPVATSSSWWSGGSSGPAASEIRTLEEASHCASEPSLAKKILHEVEQFIKINIFFYCYSSICLSQKDCGP